MKKKFLFLLLLTFLLIPFKANAAVSGYTKGAYAVWTAPYAVATGSVGSYTWSSYYDMSGTYNPSGAVAYRHVLFDLFGTSTYTYKKNYTYTITFRMSSNSANTGPCFVERNLYASTTTANNDYYTFNDKINSTSSCLIEQSGDGGFITKYTFVATMPADYHAFQLNLKGPANNTYYVGGTMKLYDVSITYQQDGDFSGAIDNQTGVIIQQGDEIKNSINETNKELEDLNSTINDDNVDKNIEDATNFFSDIADTTPSGSLGEFLTIPLTFVNSLLDESCSEITLPLPFVDMNIVLPCMDSFWNKMGSIKSIVHIVWLAIVGSKIISSIFQLTVETVDMNPNKSDPVCLKTWEL